MHPSNKPPRREFDAATRLRLAACAQEFVCPSCGSPVDPDTRLGTGAVRDGYFCSLSCLAAQHYRSPAAEQT